VKAHIEGGTINGNGSLKPGKPSPVLALQMTADGIESAPLLGMVHKKSRRSLWALIEIYSQLLAKIEASNYDVLSQRIALSTKEKCWIVARAIMR